EYIKRGADLGLEGCSVHGQGYLEAFGPLFRPRQGQLRDVGGVRTNCEGRGWGATKPVVADGSEAWVSKKKPVLWRSER
ncbi:hypothetical protein SK128_018134, partial [Halocaridina rubra]